VKVNIIHDDILIYPQTSESGRIEIGYEVRTGMQVGTTPIVCRILAPLNYPDCWFYVPGRSLFKILAEIKDGFIPEWMSLACYEQGWRELVDAGYQLSLFKNEHDVVARDLRDAKQLNQELEAKVAELEAKIKEMEAQPPWKPEPSFWIGKLKQETAP
jgi:hypothetical protein